MDEEECYIPECYEEYGYNYDYFDDERFEHEAMEYCNEECFNQDIGCFEKCVERYLEGDGDYE